MAQKKIEITAEMLREAYIACLQAKRKANAEAIADFTEQELADFIRQYADANFKGIYAETDHNYYDRISKQIPLNQEMKAANEAADLRYFSHLKLYSMFLESKHYKNLFKRRIAGPNEKPATPAAPSQSTGSGTSASNSGSGQTPTTPSVPPFREETEGERKHVTKEMEVIYRNPALRQACLDKYGYQCQCCGMDFAEMYGEELGARFIEVHHLKLISTFETDGVPENFVENLVPLCSNCHSMIHHIKDSEHTLRDLREAYRGEKKELKIRKDD